MIIHNRKRKSKKVLTNGYTFSQKQRREKLLGHLKEIDPISKNRSMFDMNTFICSSCKRSISEHPTMVIGTFSTRPYHGDMCPFLFVDRH